MAAITAGIFSASAEIETFAASVFSGDDTGYVPGAGRTIASFTSEYLDLVTDYGDKSAKCWELWTSDMRVFPGNTLTITPKDGRELGIEKVNFYYKEAVGSSSNSQTLSIVYSTLTQENIEAPASQITINGSQLLWTLPEGEQAIKVVVNGPQENQARISSFSVEFNELVRTPIEVAAPHITGDLEFEESTVVTITAEDGADIYYTTDLSYPTERSLKYTEPFTITETTTVKAIAVKEGVSSTAVEAIFVKKEGQKEPVVGEIPDDVTLSPAPGDVKASEFGKGLKITFDGVSIIMNPENIICYIEGGGISRWVPLTTERLGTNEGVFEILPSSFPEVGEYKFTITTDEGGMQNTGGYAQKFGTFIVVYNITELGEDPEFKPEEVPANVTVDPAPGLLTSVNATITVDNCYSIFGADGKELVTMVSPEGEETHIAVKWAPENPKFVSFTVPVDKMEKGTYDFIVDFNQTGVYIYSNEYGETMKLPVFHFEYNYDPAGVEGIAGENETFDIYGVDGRIVRRGANNLDGLAKGIYIAGGKKVLVK